MDAVSGFWVLGAWVLGTAATAWYSVYTGLVDTLHYSLGAFTKKEVDEPKMAIIRNIA